ncbi:MAG: hypothetical protein UDS46_05985 [Bacteroidales bacterium]|nr:hypothetical protein [Bacteroidales bacterium]
MGKIGDLWVKLKLKSDEYKKGLDEAKGKTRKFSDGLKSMSNMAVAIWAAIGAAATKMSLDFVKSSQTIGDQWDILMTQVSTRLQQIRAEVNRGIAEGGVKGFFKALFSDSTEVDAMDVGKAMSMAQDAMTEIEYAFRINMAQTKPKLHELYLKMMNSALSATDREAAATDYRKQVENIYKPRVAGLKDIMDKTVQQYLVIAGMDKNKYSTDKTIDLIKMMGSQPEKVEAQYNDFFKGYQSVGDKISGNLVNTMEAYYNATNEMNDMLKRADRTAQSMEKTGLDDIIKKLGGAKDGMADFRAQVAEEAEAIAADDAFQKAADPLLEFENTHSEVLDRLNNKQQVFADLVQDSYAQAARAAYEYAQQEQESMDLANEAAETAMEGLQRLEDMSVDIGDYLGNAFAASVSDSFQTLTDALTGVSDFDAGTLVSALLEPFANMAKQLGEFMMSAGAAILIAKKFAFTNPGAMIAAGAALTVLGAALSSGIQAISSSLGSGGDASTSSASAGSSTSTIDSNVSTEMTIYVKGKLSGKDIVISGDNARNYYGR